MLGWGPVMKSLIGYGLAGLIFFTADAAVDPGIGPQEQLSDDRAAPSMKPAAPLPDVAVPPLSADKAISDALAAHGNQSENSAERLHGSDQDDGEERI